MNPRATPADRLRQTWRLVRRDGVSGLTARLMMRAAVKLTPAGYTALPVDRDDLLAASEIVSSGWTPPDPPPAAPGEPLVVSWIIGPPHPAVGGHNTMFRQIGALERAGHTCVLYVYDLHGWDLEQHRHTIRSAWPSIRAEVRAVADGIEDSHVIFATGWPTAYPALASRAAGVRCYFVQDFEPAFYPAGSEALLAEATYRFGFHGITIGKWLAHKLDREYDMTTAFFEFGCDLERYGLADGTASARKSVCYYCRPGTARRAYELAMIALDLFAARHPEVDIHLFGRPAGRVPFRATDHGILDPDQLNALYNRCIAGLALSATNSSLVPFEMLAAGCIPVVNDGEHNRAVLENEHVVYSPATPFHLADSLSALVSRPDVEIAEGARQASRSVHSTTWEQAGAQFERAVTAAVAARGPSLPVR